MNHQTIEDQLIVERYVAGKLGEGEAAAFEEHYLDCQACIDRVEDAERLERGLRGVAEQEVEKTVKFGILGWLARIGRSPAVALALVMAAVLPAGLLWRQVGDLRQQLEGSRRPQVNTSIYSLSPFRGAGPGTTGPAHQISLAGKPEWLVLSLDPGSEHPTYRATLLESEGNVVWQASNLVPDPLGAVVVTFHSTFLQPGEYQLRLEALPAGDGDPRPAGRFPLRVVDDAAGGAES